MKLLAINILNPDLLVDDNMWEQRYCCKGGRKALYLMWMVLSFIGILQGIVSVTRIIKLLVAEKVSNLLSV